MRHRARAGGDDWRKEEGRRRAVMGTTERARRRDGETVESQLTGRASFVRLVGRQDRGIGESESEIEIGDGDEASRESRRPSMERGGDGGDGGGDGGDGDGGGGGGDGGRESEVGRLAVAMGKEEGKKTSRAIGGKNAGWPALANNHTANHETTHQDELHHTTTGGGNEISGRDRARSGLLPFARGPGDQRPARRQQRQARRVIRYTTGPLRQSPQTAASFPRQAPGQEKSPAGANQAR
ncbi:hypothetical protein DRE_05941 [Drechslerella stenobrocha 248]|uniref:Uncharacterized protein n=1 Tax=Drechslerella stenobrocha 248 TaxID=1043628 RepID=W7HPZ9_9PEZI|nr:hypothetical protein DRE_05941 [Drechslerella stenobrocha 248]